MSVHVREQLPFPDFLDWFGRERLSPEGQYEGISWMGRSTSGFWEGTVALSLLNSISKSKHWLRLRGVFHGQDYGVPESGSGG